MITARLHGLRIRSARDLGGTREPGSGPVDVRVVEGSPRSIGDDPPAGRVLAAVRDDALDRPFSTIVARDDGAAVLRVHRVCDVEIGPGRDVLLVDRDPSAAPGLADVVVSGMGVALAVMLRGHLVLHASAVELDGRAVAFVGASGMGKSTIAALCCAAGARLLGDDVLRVDVDAAVPMARRGSTFVRIRPEAAQIGTLFPVATTVSADDRIELVPRACRAERVPLAAVLVPARADGAHVDVVWQTGARRLMVLEMFPRLLGWTDPEIAGRQFALRANLAERVPVGVVSLPAGPPFDPGVADEILAAVGGRVASVG